MRKFTFEKEEKEGYVEYPPKTNDTKNSETANMNLALERREILYIDEQIKLPINGVEQYISMRAKRAHAPVLLYLHGGPGDAALPLVLKFNKELEDFFTVVVWEQRGAGKSYYPFAEDCKITIDTFIEDLHQLVLYLLQRFNEEKVYLVGHSWGSVLGLRFISKYPQYIHTYIGCGQVVNMKKSCQIAYDFVMENADASVKQKVKAIDCSYTKDHWMQDLLFVTKQVVKCKGSLYGKRNYNALILPFLFSRYYSISDLISRIKGGEQSIKFLWQELMQTNYEDIVQYEVPVIFVEGRYDKHVSSELAESYYERIRSEKQFVWFEHSCHFPQWSENRRFNQLLIGLL